MIAFFVVTPHGESEHDSIEIANVHAACERARFAPNEITVEARDVEPEEITPRVQGHEFDPVRLCCAFDADAPVHHAFFRRS